MATKKSNAARQTKQSRSAPVTKASRAGKRVVSFPKAGKRG